MLVRFIIYGFVGWIVEVIFTGAAAAAFNRDRAGTARTCLWMHPIYGATMLGLEWIGDHSRFLPWMARGLLYVAAIYAAELSSGWLLRLAPGKCPWDYGRAGLAVPGLIRLDHAPAWYVAALAFEPLSQTLHIALKAVMLSQPMLSVAG